MIPNPEGCAGAVLLYNACTRGLMNPLAPLTIQYKDYAIWQQQQVSNSSKTDHRLYWLQQFEGELPVLELPASELVPYSTSQH